MALLGTDLLKVEKADGSKAKTTAGEIVGLLTLANSLTVTAPGQALDATQGKILNDKIDGLGSVHAAADITERDAFIAAGQSNSGPVGVLDVFHVEDDGDGKWAKYQVLGLGPNVIVKTADEDALAAGLGATNLGYTAAANGGTVTNTSGADAFIPLATGALAGLLSPADKGKLNNITITGGVDLDAIVTASHDAFTLAANTGFTLTGQTLTNSYAALPAA